MSSVGSNSPRVLVLLATFNGAGSITRQLHSILTQRNVDLTIRVSDDASNDDTLARIESFADPRIYTLQRASGSGSAAQNFISLIRDNSGAGFDFVAFSDQDDVWLPDKLARACQCLISNDAAGYSSAVNAIWPDGSIRVMQQSRRMSSADFIFEGGGQGCTYVIRADFFERARQTLLLNPELARKIRYHDWAIYSLARVWNLGWHFDPWPSVNYYQHVSNDIGARGSLRSLRRRIELLRLGIYTAQISAVTSICEVAGSDNPALRRWHDIWTLERGLCKRATIARFSLAHGRRRITDRVLTSVAALCGWLS